MSMRTAYCVLVCFFMRFHNPLVLPRCVCLTTSDSNTPCTEGGPFVVLCRKNYTFMLTLVCIIKVGMGQVCLTESETVYEGLLLLLLTHGPV